MLVSRTRDRVGYDDSTSVVAESGTLGPPPSTVRTSSTGTEGGRGHAVFYKKKKVTYSTKVTAVWVVVSVYLYFRGTYTHFSSLTDTDTSRVSVRSYSSLWSAYT